VANFGDSANIVLQLLSEEMTNKIDNWILNELGAQISRRDGLLPLCLVSKKFNFIFTPYLYRRIMLYDNAWSRLKSLCKHSPRQHLEYTREVYVGSDYVPDETLEREVFLVLFRMKNLRVFTYVVLSSQSLNSLND